MPTRGIYALAFAIILSSAAILAGEQWSWPQWRGPNRTDVSKETGLLQAWPEGGPKRVWLFKDCGVGYSGSAITDGKLVTMGSRNGTEQLIALDVETGQELWAADIGEEYDNGWGNGPRGTPTIHDGHVYALSAQGDLICVRLGDGDQVWKIDVKDFGGSIPGWGYTESVLIEGNMVICTPGGSDGAVLAVSKETGEKVWQSEEFTDGAQYSSIIAADVNGQRQLIQLVQKNLFGLEASTGKLLWKSSWPGRTAVIPTSIVEGNSVYVSSGYGAGCKLLKIDGGNNATEVYANKVMKNQHGGVILLGEHLYGYSDGFGWVCQNFTTGEKVSSERRAFGKGAIAYADGRFYCVSEDEGEVVLIAASPEGWKEHGRFTLDPQTELRKSRGRIWVHPTVVNGKLFLRDQDLLYCYDVKAGPA